MAATPPSANVRMPFSASERRQGIRSFLIFAVFNALCFEIVGGRILYLFARQIGASAVQIGIVASLLPFAGVVLFGVAPFVRRFGPRRILLVGWSSRTLVACGLLTLPTIVQRYGSSCATHSLIAIMAVFYLCRTLGLASWLPLVQGVVPPRIRGKFIGKQMIIVSLSVIFVSVLTAIYLIGATDLSPFLGIFSFGILCGAISISILFGIPSIEGTDEPILDDFWGKALFPLRDREYRNFLLFAVSLQLVAAGLPPFMVLFLKESLHLSSSGVVFFTAVESFGALLSLLWWGPAIDRHGSKPFMGLALLGWGAILVLWAVMPSDPWARFTIVPFAAMAGGAFSAGLITANSRLNMNLIPWEQNASYAAASQMCTGLAAGISPLIGGLIVRSMEGRVFHCGPIALDNYRVFFLYSSLMLSIPIVLRTRINEHRVESMRTVMRRYLLLPLSRWAHERME